MPGVLTENGFIDHAGDAAKLKSDSYLNRIALGHANGIAKALGLKKKSKPGKPAKSKPKTKPSGYTGDSLVDYLKSIKVDSSFSNRAKLAGQYGISNYTGTANQNTQLLNKLRGNSKPAAKKGDQKN